MYDISGERWHYAPLECDKPSLLQRISGPCGNDILLEWNDNLTLHALTDSAGQRVVCRYEGDRLAGAWLNDEICLISYAYDEQRQLVSVTGRGGSVRRRFRWQDGLMCAHEDANGLVSEYRWQEIAGLPRVTAFRHSGGEQLTFEYDFDNGTRRAIRDDGAQAHWLIDDDDNVAAFTDFDGRKTAFIYREGELCNVILPGGRQNITGSASPIVSLARSTRTLLRPAGRAIHRSGSYWVKRRMEPVPVCAEPARVDRSLGVEQMLWKWS